MTALTLPAFTAPNWCTDRSTSPSWRRAALPIRARRCRCPACPRCVHVLGHCLCPAFLRCVRVLRHCLCPAPPPCSCLQTLPSAFPHCIRILWHCLRPAYSHCVRTLRHCPCPAFPLCFRFLPQDCRPALGLPRLHPVADIQGATPCFVGVCAREVFRTSELPHTTHQSPQPTAATPSPRAILSLFGERCLQGLQPIMAAAPVVPTLTSVRMRN